MPVPPSDSSVPLATPEQQREQSRLEAQGLEPEPGTDRALCLSGGGYRAMLFHLGSLWRLNETGLLGRVDRISSVSGGSITAGVLATAWPSLGLGADRPAARPEDFERHVVRPIRGLAGRTLDVPSVLLGLLDSLLGRGSVGGRIAASYREHLFGAATLADLRDHPRFVLNATNLATGALWRSSKPYMGDWRIGRIPDPQLSIAEAVAASSAFPPFLSPLSLPFDPDAFTLRDGTDLDDPAFRSRVFLTDGGVYDNLGLETAWSYRSLLVSDGGGAYRPDARPRRFWPLQLLRVLDTIDRQVLALRKRELIGAYEKKPENPDHKDGAYWGIRTEIATYDAPDKLPVDQSRALELAALPTRLARLPDATQERVINWGYAITDAAVRTFVDRGLPAPEGFPYPRGV